MCRPAEWRNSLIMMPGNHQRATKVRGVQLDSALIFTELQVRHGPDVNATFIADWSHDALLVRPNELIARQ
jgi:hypothetical protein